MDPIGTNAMRKTACVALAKWKKSNSMEEGFVYHSKKKFKSGKDF